MTTLKPATLKDVRWKLGWTPEHIAKYLDVNLQTYYRWEDGKSRIPLPAYRLLELLAGCDLGNIHPAWSGWSIGHNGELYPPAMVRGMTPGMVAARPWHVQQIAALKARIRRIESEPRQFSMFDKKVSTL